MLKRYNRLTKRGSFAYVYNKGQSQSAKLLRFCYVKNKKGVKIGFTINNKIGKAVVRNKIKRQMRAIMIPLIKDIKPVQAVFVAKEGISLLSYSQLNKLMLDLLIKSKLYEKSN